MHLVDNDERFRSFSALLNDAKRVAAVEQHGSHHGDVEFSERRRQIIRIPIIDPGIGLQSGVTEPVGILQLLHHDSTWAEYLFQSRSRVGDKVPAVLVCYFDGDNVGAPLFHLEGEKPAGRTNFQNPLTGKIDFAEVFIYCATQIPIAPLYDSMAGEFHRVVKVTVRYVVDVQRRGENLVVASTF